LLSKRHLVGGAEVDRNPVCTSALLWRNLRGYVGSQRYAPSVKA